jgi:hypothetical protein
VIEKKKLANLLFLIALFGNSLIANAELVRSKKAKASAGALAQDEVRYPEDKLDQFYRIKKVFLFPAIDDINNVMAPNLDQKLVELFNANSRFELLADKSVIKALSFEDENYPKIAQSQSVHREAAKATQADATVLLRSRTAAGKTEIILDWRDSNGVILLSQSNTLPSFSSLGAQETLLAGIFTDCVRHIPFDGGVTGRTGQTITVDLGEGLIGKGDIIDIGRVVAVQRHPLLKTLTKADFVKVGVAKIRSVDRVLSFAEVLEEAPNESIGVDNKIIGIKRAEKMAAPEPKQVPMYNSRQAYRPQEELQESKKEDDGWDEQFPAKKRLNGDFDRPKARLGHVGVSAAPGNISHTNNSTGTTTSVSGNGVGAAVAGELWVTRDWILGLDYSYQSATLAGTQGSSAISVGSSSWRRMDFYGAYRFFPSGKQDSTAVSFGLGYQTKQANIAPSTAAGTSFLKYSGVLFRVEGDVPFSLNNRALIGLSLVPFGSAPGFESINSLGFKIGWSFLVDGTLWGRLMFDYDSANGSTLNGSSSRTDQRYAIEPGIFYYF